MEVGADVNVGWSEGARMEVGADVNVGWRDGACVVVDHIRNRDVVGAGRVAEEGIVCLMVGTAVGFRVGTGVGNSVTG